MVVKRAGGAKDRPREFATPPGGFPFGLGGVAPTIGSANNRMEGFRMSISIEKNVELLENKVHTMEVALMSLIQAVGLVAPGAVKDTVDLVLAQANTARSRGDELAFVLLAGMAERIGCMCDLPGFDEEA